MLQKTIKLSTIQEKVSYRVNTLRRSFILGTHNEDETEEIFEKELVDKDIFGNLFRVTLIKRWHSNQSKLHIIEDELALLKGNLLLRTNDLGEITTVLNLEEIEYFWNEHKLEFHEKHSAYPYIDKLVEDTAYLLQNQDAFSKEVQASDMASVLFPPLYNIMLSDEQNIKQDKIITNFFDSEALPLAINTSIINHDKYAPALEILREGRLNTTALNTDKVQLYLQELSNNPNTLRSLKVSYTEFTNLDMFYWVDKVKQTLTVTAEDFYSQLIVHATPLLKAL